jgi:hypothetical protein
MKCVFSTKYFGNWDEEEVVEQRVPGIYGRDLSGTVGYFNTSISRFEGTRTRIDPITGQQADHRVFYIK